jgi:3-hydroxybutyrate dehydrogenase
MNIEVPRPTAASARVLDGKVAVITGSTSGIGLGIARAFASAGASVVINGFGKPEEIEHTLAALQDGTSTRAIYSSADMTRPGEIADMIRTVVETFGRLDILVNNAGIQHVSPIEQFPIEKWDAVIAIDLSSAFHTIRVALPEMRRLGGGRIINIASAHALVGSPFKAAYVAAKHGTVGLTKVVALETAEAGITVNAICPGYIATEMVKAIDEKVLSEKIIPQIPVGRLGEPEEIARTVVFLASDDAGFITGSTISANGGQYFV